MNLEIDVKSIIISKLKHSLYIVVVLLLGETWENLENLGKSGHGVVVFARIVTLV